MKPLRQRMEALRRQSGSGWEILERDYALSWVLAGIAGVRQLHDHLVFKGGTALKKCYFGDYRFSEDLDFSTLPGGPVGEALEVLMQNACRQAQTLVAPFAALGIDCARYAEKHAHPEGQEAFDLRVHMPWHRRPHTFTRVRVEITHVETIMRPVQRRPVLHEYGEPLHVQLQVYALEEVLAEKLRALLQHAEKLRQRTWGRSRARDYYDIWRILGQYGETLDLADFSTLLRAKCAVRNVGYIRLEDFFQAHLIEHVRKTWDDWLGNIVPRLPAFDTVIADLRAQLAPHVR